MSRNRTPTAGYYSTTPSPARTPISFVSPTQASRKYKSPENSQVNSKNSSKSPVASRARTPDSSSRVITELKNKLYTKEKEIKELNNRLERYQFDANTITTKLQSFQKYEDEMRERDQQIRDLKVLIRTYEEKFKLISTKIATGSDPETKVWIDKCAKLEQQLKLKMNSETYRLASLVTEGDRKNAELQREVEKLRAKAVKYDSVEVILEENRKLKEKLSSTNILSPEECKAIENQIVELEKMQSQVLAENETIKTKLDKAYQEIEQNRDTSLKFRELASAIKTTRTEFKQFYNILSTFRSGEISLTGLLSTTHVNPETYHGSSYLYCKTEIDIMYKELEDLRNLASDYLAEQVGKTCHVS